MSKLDERQDYHARESRSEEPDGINLTEFFWCIFEPPELALLHHVSIGRVEIMLCARGHQTSHSFVYFYCLAAGRWMGPYIRSCISCISLGLQDHS